MKDLLSFLLIPASLAVFLFAFMSPSRPAALLGAGIGLALAAVMARRGAIVVLIILLLALTGCTGDPFGLAAAEHERAVADVQIAQVQADAATNQARITASTERVRVGGWMTAVLIGGIVIVACVVVASMTYLQAQRDRLSADQWRAQLPRQQTPTASLPRQHTPAHWLALSRPRPEPTHTLALPARSESATDVIVIDG